MAKIVWRIMEGLEMSMDEDDIRAVMVDTYIANGSRSDDPEALEQKKMLIWLLSLLD
jgi:hypothetical protein